jgi:hypothetical protein
MGAAMSGRRASAKKRRPVSGLAFVALAVVWLIAWAPLALYCAFAAALLGRRRRDQAAF